MVFVVKQFDRSRSTPIVPLRKETRITDKFSRNGKDLTGFTWGFGRVLIGKMAGWQGGREVRMSGSPEVRKWESRKSLEAGCAEGRANPVAQRIHRVSQRGSADLRTSDVQTFGLSGLSDFPTPQLNFQNRQELGKFYNA